MVWESSRVGEWVRLLELCEQRSVSIFVTMHSCCYDPGNGRDRRSLLEDAVDSEYESSKISLGPGGRRSMLRWVVRTGGFRMGPAGVRPQTRQLIAQKPEPAEAEVSPSCTCG